MNDKIINEIYSTYMSEENLKHAYLIESHNDDHKSIFKLASKVIGEKYNEELILNNSNPNIKVVYPDGNDIKKSQILELQDEFFHTSVNEAKRIYIISDASKLNKSSANTLLKFLEEPPKGVVAFLLTNNRHNIIRTIASRCISISLNLKKQKEELDESFVKIFDKLIINKSSFFVSLDAEEKKIMHDKQGQKEFYKTAIQICHEKIKSEKNYKDLKEYTKKNLVFIEMIELLDKNINPKMVLNKMLYLIYGGGTYA